MDERTKAAFSGATDSAKQLITLATGLIAVEVTFGKDFLIQVNTLSKWFMVISWVLFLLSVILGVGTLNTLIGCIAKSENLSSQTIYDPNVKRLAKTQIFLFLIGLGFMVAFGIFGFVFRQ